MIGVLLRLVYCVHCCLLCDFSFCCDDFMCRFVVVWCVVFRYVVFASGLLPNVVCLCVALLLLPLCCVLSGVSVWYVCLLWCVLLCLLFGVVRFEFAFVVCINVIVCFVFVMVWLFVVCYLFVVL